MDVGDLRPVSFSLGTSVGSSSALSNAIASEKSITVTFSALQIQPESSDNPNDSILLLAEKDSSSTGSPPSNTYRPVEYISSSRHSLTSAQTPPVPIPPGFQRGTIASRRNNTSSKSMISPCASDDIPFSLHQSQSFTTSKSFQSHNYRREDRFHTAHSDDELADVDDDDSIAWDFGSSPPPLPLTPFKNQVGGHAAFLRFSDKALCKPLDTREQNFYEYVQAHTPELTEFMASYLGLVNVTFRANAVSNNTDESSTENKSSSPWDSTPVIMLERNPHIFLDHLDDENTSGGEGFSSPASGDSFPGGTRSTLDGCRYYNRKLQQQIFRDALSPKSLRARFSQIRASSQVFKSKGDKKADVSGASSNSNLLEVVSPEHPFLTASFSHSKTESHDEAEDEMHSLDFLRKGPPRTTSVDTRSSSQSHGPTGLAFGSTESQAVIFQMSDDEDGNAQNSSGDKPFVRRRERTAHSAGSDVKSPPHVKQTPLTHQRKARSADQRKVMNTPSVRSSQMSDRRDIGSDFNPWSLHLYQTKMGHLFSDSQEATHKFLLLEDLTEGLRSPCILDLKMGTRQYGVNATFEKKASQERKCDRSTSKKLGTRICGMQLYRQDTHSFTYLDKYAGRQINVSNFKQSLLSYLDDGNLFLIGYIPSILEQLHKLYNIVSKLQSFRFYGTSLLILYDSASAYDSPSSTPQRDVQIRMIDFANCVTNGNRLKARQKSQTPTSPDTTTFASTPASLDDELNKSSLKRDDPLSDPALSPAASDNEEFVYVNYPPTTMGPDGGYLLGLKSLIANFEEIYRDLNFDSTLLDANGHLPKTSLPNSQRAMAELGLGKQSVSQATSVVE